MNILPPITLDDFFDIFSLIVVGSVSAIIGTTALALGVIFVVRWFNSALFRIDVYRAVKNKRGDQ